MEGAGDELEGACGRQWQAVPRAKSSSKPWRLVCSGLIRLWPGPALPTRPSVSLQATTVQSYTANPDDQGG